MGFTRTIHCLAFSKEKEGKIYEYHAMNRREVCQVRLEAKKKELEISHWVAQTKTGRKILGMDGYEHYKDDENVKVKGISLVECPKCKGDGCQICNWAGRTTQAHLNKYLPWQLEPEKP